MDDMRDPNNSMGKLKCEYRFKSGNVLPAGTVIEIDLSRGEEWAVGYCRGKGTVFAVERDDVEIIEGPITPRLF